MKTKRTIIFCFLILSVVSIVICAPGNSALGQVHEVWVDGNWAGRNPGETVDGHVYGTDAFSKIQDGIDAISSPGTVNVAAGLYTEKIILKDALHLLGAGAGVTTIDGGGDGAVVSASSVGAETVIEGFTIQNGLGGPNDGAGIDLAMSSPLVRNNVIAHNQGWGIQSLGATPQIVGNSIAQNAGGIRIFGSQPLIAQNHITENAGYGIESLNAGVFTIVNNVIEKNGSDGAKLMITSGAENIRLINNTIVGNAGAGLGSNRSPSLHFLNNIVSFNGACGIRFESAYDWGAPDSDHNAFWANTGGNTCGVYAFGSNDLVSDPMFLDVDGGDYHLSISSPCIYTAAASVAPDTDIEGHSRPQGPGYDIGAYEATGYVQSRPVIESFAADVAEGTAPFDVTFNCVANDPDGNIVGYVLHFGDTSDPETNGTGVFTHTYTTGGRAYATCQATDDSGIVVQSPSIAIVRHGDILVPSEYTTIQAAIDIALDGDTVVVADGTYTGYGNKNLDFKGKAITVRSQNGPEHSIIDCENEGRGFNFHSGEGAASVVSGFTITNGRVDFGGGISCDHASPTIENCIVKNNWATYSGGGIHCWYSSPKILNNIVRDNSSEFHGGGIHVGTASSPVIENCGIFDNWAEDGGGGIYAATQDLSITRCRIMGNSTDFQGGGIYFTGGAGTVTNGLIVGNSAADGGGIFSSYTSLKTVNCTISGNTAQNNGGGVHFWGSNPSDPAPVIINTIVWENTPSEIYKTEVENIAVSYSNVHGGYPGEGNRFGDPTFVNAAGGDFHLLTNSPCMYAGTTTDAPDVDIEGNPRPQGYGIDMGAYETTGYNKQRPIIDGFTADRTQYHVPFEVTLVCAAHDPDGEITNYTIDYGDGSPADGAADGVFHHVYAAAGLSYATCTAIDNSGAATNSFYRSIEVRTVPTPDQLLNIFAMELGNHWTYEGVSEGVPHVIERDITDIDHNTFPVPTYVYTIKQDGVIVGTERYERVSDRVELWGMTGESEGAFYTFQFAQGLTAAWYPMQVGGHAYSTTTMLIENLSFNVSLVVDIISKTSVTLAFDTVDAYALSYQLRVWGNGMDITDGFTWWMVPYIGVVKDQYSDNLVVQLSDLAIGGGGITLTSDADSDGLSDYDELFIDHTHMQFADTDFDGCNDGAEVAGRRSPLDLDPQGDMNADCAIDLKDAVIALQIASGLTPGSFAGIGADANADSKIGLGDAAYIIQRIVDAR